MSVLIGVGLSEVGNVRQHNEDKFLVDRDSQLFAVADGMGGHAAGEFASQLAVSSVHRGWTVPAMRRCIDHYAENADPGARCALMKGVRQSVMEAHLAIVEEAGLDYTKVGMGTTFTGFLVAGGDVIFAHIGDSRAYIVRDEIAMQLTEDHTMLARMRAAGMTSSQEMREKKRWKGILTGALGIDSGTLRVATFIVPLCAGDRFLLCSDGVYEYFSEAEIGKIMVASTNVVRAAETFVEQSLQRGGADNATAVVCEVQEVSETRVPSRERERDEQAAARCPLLAELSPQECLRVLRLTTRRRLKAGKELAPVALGERVSYVVLSGEIKDSRGIYGPGAVIYPEALVASSPMPERSMRAVVQEVTHLLTIRRGDFLQMSGGESELASKLRRALAQMVARGF